MTLQGAVGRQGNIAGWPEVPFRAFLRRIEKAGNTDLPLLGVGLHEGVRRRNESDGRPAASEDLSSYKLVREGDVVMNRLGKPHGSVGVSPWRGITSPAYWVLEIDRSLASPAFVHHLLRSSHLVREYERLGKYMPPNQFDISWEAFRSIEVPLPPLEEQRRIADFLDAETAKIGSTVQKRLRQREILDELALSTTDAAIAELSEVHWIRLGYLASIQSGVTVDGNREQDSSTITMPYLRVANVQADHIDLNQVAEISVSRRVAAASRLQVGDVLMTEGGDLDKLGRGTVWRGEIPDCLHQNHVFAVRPNNRILTSEYLALLTRASIARSYFESTGNKTTNLASTSSSKIRDFRVPLVDVSKQEYITEEVGSKNGSIAEAAGKMSRQLHLLTERRQALITAAVTGRVDVTAERRLAEADGVDV
ncbi:restriction endonuclease subunit S [Lentzea sp. NPDC060358]|uniref:restriction endonuclease subunit S n=1 Tax=Lentzea sp. NPDC060358 TaxID=3347103 RepID=UPI00365483D7